MNKTKRAAYQPRIVRRLFNKFCTIKRAFKSQREAEEHGNVFGHVPYVCRTYLPVHWHLTTKREL